MNNNSPSIVRCHMEPSIDVLHLICHIYPSRRDDTWRDNVEQIKKRMHIFSGRRIVAIATDPGSRRADDVLTAFDDPSIEYGVFRNNPRRRETATFAWLLDQIHSVAVNEAAFYCHSKGCGTSANAAAVKVWRDAMYHYLLDHVYTCRDLLWSHPCVGTFKTTWPEHVGSLFPTGVTNRYRWMYSGTFFWFRNRDVFSHDKWDNVAIDRYGAEAWLGDLFRREQAATIYQPFPVNEYPTPSPYDIRLYR